MVAPQGAFGAAQGGGPLGLSQEHIPSSSIESHNEPATGEFRDIEEGRYCHGPDEIDFIHAAGCGTISNGDHWYSARRWRDGISVGTGPCRGGRGSTVGRGKVRQFTAGSRSRMVRFLREAAADYRFMGTLTVGAEYSRDPADFRRAVDRYLVQFVRELRKAHVRKGGSPSEASVFWWVEFQTRGAPHLHMYYTARVDWTVLAKIWARLCLRFNLCGSHEVDYFWRTSTRFEKIRAGFRGMVAYARKYAYKHEQKQEVEGTFENGWNGRFWGVRGLRARGSCHVLAHGRSPASRHIKDLKEWLETLVSKGLVRKFRWVEGDGAIYFPANGGQWSEQTFHVELEMRLMRAILAIEPDYGGVNADSLQVQTE